MRDPSEHIIESEMISFSSLFAIFNKKNILKTIFILGLSLFLGMIYIYFATPRYISHASLVINATAGNQNIRHADDLISSLHQTSIMDIETELDVLRSDLLASKVISGISDGVKYFNANSLKTIEYYKDTPILLDEIKVFKHKIFKKTFVIDVIDSKNFKLSLKKSFLKNILLSISSWFGLDSTSGSKIYSFGELVKTKEYEFSINDINVEKNAKYEFYINYPQALIQEVKRNLNVKTVSARSSVIDISYEGVNPRRVKDFLDLLVNKYIVENINIKSKDASRTLRFLEKQILEVKKQLTASSDNLKTYKKENNFLNIDVKSRTVLDALVADERELAQAKLEFQEFMILEEELSLGNFTVISSAERQYPILENLVIELQAAVVERDASSSALTSQHPDVLAITNRIVSIQNNFKNVLNSFGKSLKQRIATLKHSVADKSKEVLSFPQKEQSLANFERVFAVNENLLSYLLERQSALSLKEASRVSDIRILARANMPLSASKPSKQIVLMTSLFLGLVLSLIASLLKLHGRIKTVDDLNKNTSIPLFGIIPYVKNKNNYNTAYVLEDSESTASEAFRAIRTNLDYMISNDSSKIILVTSSIPNEGKTVVSANLAAMIGMSEKKVIILALDLRRPEMHHKFGLSNKVGMSDLLSNKVKIQEVIWQHEIYPNLNIITSGKIPPNPAELISSSRLTEVLNELRKEFDYIILDTPPINYVADATVLFKHSDINLFVVKSDYTEEKHVKELSRMVDKFRLENTGIILNSVKKKYNKLEQFDSRYLYFEPI